MPAALKQSSLHSFFSHTPQKPPDAAAPPDPNHTPPPPSDDPPIEHHTPASKRKKHSRNSNPEPSPSTKAEKRSASKHLKLSPAAAPLTEYERQRQENIRRNNEFLKNLGVTAPLTIQQKPTTPVPRPRFKSAQSREPPVPLRRSARRRPEAPAEDRSPDPPLRYDDSSVLKYVCSAKADGRPGTHSDAARWRESGLVGFRRVGSEMADPMLTRIYAVDVAVLDGGGQALVAAGGHGGRISVYGTLISEVESEVAQGPLMTWKGCPSWISGVRFLRGDMVLLLSGSNDGALVVWDVGKEPYTGAGWMTPPNLASPPIVAKVDDLHSKGIFGMQEFHGRIATASKDSSVGFSCFRGSDIAVERTFAGHHYGPIRGICFRDSDILADCGADNRICVLDVRMGDACTLTIESDHNTGVNVVEWCPNNSFLVLSASKDPELLLYDIRSLKEPLHKFEGHVDPNRGKCSQIYRPAFVGNGMAVATPGQGSGQISLYSTYNGRAISRGFVGYDANLVMCNVRDEASCQRVWLAGKQITQLSPIWQDNANVSD